WSVVLQCASLSTTSARCGSGRATRCLGCAFFFQAEDGIRDWSVTGVQTCALPILVDGAHDARGDEAGVERLRALVGDAPQRLREIGRASCRERVWIAGDAAW